MAEIKNLKKAANRIKKAIKDEEKIILYSDADLDGTISLVILQEAIKNLEGDISVVYFVNREKDGYGINKTALKYLKKQAPALLIATDLGITNFEEVKLAKKMGFEVLIIDHHKVINRIPEASIVVDPKQKGDKYPFKELAAAGIVYRLAKILLKDKLTETIDNSFLELTALATIADMMLREKENKDYIEQGLKSLKNTKRPGLKIFCKLNSLKKLKDIERRQKVISALNVSDIKNHKTDAYLILTSKKEKEVMALAKKLLEKNKQRHFQIREIAQEAEKRILEKTGEPIIFEGNLNWSNLLIGSVASKMCNKYKKPCFIFNRMRGISRGTVRMPPGMDAVKVMSSCAKLLETFGGHPPAAGFSVKNKNLKQFRECLIKYFTKL